LQPLLFHLKLVLVSVVTVVTWDDAGYVSGQ